MTSLLIQPSINGEEPCILTVQTTPQINLNDLFIVNITISPTTEIGGWELVSITYPSDLVTAINITPGSEWKTFFSNGTIDNQQGTITHVQSWKTNEYPAYPHPLCHITFCATYPGSGVIEVTQISLTNPSFESILVTSPSSCPFSIIDPSQPENNPPDQPSNPFPLHHSDDVSLEQHLSWQCHDTNQDHLTYTVILDTKTPPVSIISSNISTTTTDPSLNEASTYYWQVIAKDEHGLQTHGPIWSFTTIESPSSDPPTNNSSLPITPDQPKEDSPVIEHNGPYTAHVNEPILFTAESRSDTNLESYQWNFGDGVQSFDLRTWHQYAYPGKYIVTIALTDTKGFTQIAATTATILQANTPPSKPQCIGPQYGRIDQSYQFSFQITDLDDTQISLTVDWNDKTIPQTVQHMTAEGPYEINHTWKTAGRYEINITAEDSNKALSQNTYTIYINTYPVGSLGYLLDEDDNGIFDLFHHTTTDIETDLFYENNTYYIDLNGDGTHEYQFTIDLEYPPFEQLQQSSETPAFNLIILIVALGFLIIFWRR